MSTALEKVLNITSNNLFDNASVATCTAAVDDLSNNLVSRINAVIDGAPGALNTLNELAAALGDDANYATTTAASLATKYSAGSDASFNDLSANDISGVNFFTMGGKFIGDLSGNATTATTATSATTATTATSATTATTATSSASLLSNDFNISYNSSAKQIEFKTKDLTESSLSSKMNLDNSGNLTLTGNFNSLSTSGTTSLGGHILPTTNAAYDLGSAEYKIRHLFLSNNSLWIGDNHKIDISGGNMRFKKRKNDKVPAAVTSAGGNETDALAHAGVSALTDMTLDKWQNYAATLSGAPGIKEMFGNDQPDEFDTDKDLLNSVISPLKTDAGAPPTSPTPATGTMIYNTNENKLYIYNGGWRSSTFVG
jgi:hypothetical protein